MRLGGKSGEKIFASENRSGFLQGSKEGTVLLIIPKRWCKNAAGSSRKQRYSALTLQRFLHAILTFLGWCYFDFSGFAALPPSQSRTSCFSRRYPSEKTAALRFSRVQFPVRRLHFFYHYFPKILKRTMFHYQ